ncbi:MAG: hypothetical protein JW909_01500 [Planctomycetes bacterium]|nr:hypothetical protein [Planctomycetota bacterium]
MKFAVGYQLAEPGDEPFADIVADYRDHVAEVYFPWLDAASGRAALATRRGYTDWMAQERLEDDLKAFRKAGMRLDVLFNANCYGGMAVSRYLENQVISILEHLAETAGAVDAVTTTSLAVARTVKKYFPGTEVRASVNMRIGTVKGMEYVAGLFDGYYVMRELNRSPSSIAELKEWADANGRKLYMLANSGCLNYCSGQTFHDNMVAHEREIDETANIEGWTPHVCWNLFRDRAKRVKVLQNSWVRPEDLHRYEGLFDVVKLATRMHSRPRTVMEAYTRGRYDGNLLDLLEPGFAPAFHPDIIDNTLFPKDWWEKTSSCDKRCHRCGYCEDVFRRVLVRMEDGDA